ncbi:hypothetical protein [Flavobacterium sp. I3-2]|nr:hypothetical protein [Flavobacterium sp. I3-2]
MEFVFLTLAVVVVVMFAYRALTRKKKEREYFPDDFNADGTEKKYDKK